MAIEHDVRIWALLALASLGSASCSADGGSSSKPSAGGSGGAGAAAGVGGSGASVAVDGGAGTKSSGDPQSCAEAAAAKSYIGCDFWPTAVANSVWSEFDFAVVVANAGDVAAEVVIDRNGLEIAKGTVAPNGLEKFYLPWVPELKGDTFDACGQATPLSATVRVDGGAYHLVSSLPVTVYQFNALEYRGQGGPPGKSWDSCPGNQICDLFAMKLGCYSFSNDASLLLPSTALTGNYRITSQTGMPQASMSPYFAVTGIHDGTTVTLRASSTAEIVAGGGVAAIGPGEITQLALDRGDVIQLLGTPNADLAGSLVQADRPVQVIAGVPCIHQPLDAPACDHIEETVPPAETLGKRYFVASPTGALGNVVGHLVRLFGNVDGTQLSYPSGAPANAPTTIDAGQVIDLGKVLDDFEIVADHELAIGTFMLGGTLQDPGTSPPNQKGDPSMSLVTAVEQFRTKYVFLAPDDYDVSYADLIVPDGASVTLDGAPLQSVATPIGSGYGIARVKLGPGVQGAHVLESTHGVGLQVMGYGSYTSYQYPGGLNLETIAPPPPPVR